MPEVDDGVGFEIFHDTLADPILDWRTRREQIQRERQIRKRFRARLRRVALGVLIVLAVATAVSTVALLGRRDARRQANVATSQRLAALAASRQGVDESQA